MTSWIVNNAATVVICIALFALLALIIRTMVKNRKSGKSNCGCGCSSCAMSGSCHGNTKK